ncbi:MAG: glycerol dehydrogenase [Bacteroidales bacterium]
MIDKTVLKPSATASGLLKAAFPGKYIQGEHALSMVPELIESFGGKGLVLASPSVISGVLSDYPFRETNVEINVETFRGECSRTELDRLSRLVESSGPGVVIGMGGGKVIDTAKIVADKANIPVIIVPTIASTDAPCSGCAVIYDDEGVFESVYYQKMNPQVVLVDTRVIADAPVRFLLAGMGDALATWFEARSCRRSHSKNECGGYSTLTGFHLARLCYDTLLEYGPAAKVAAEQKIITPALDHIIEANILLSGLGFESSGLAAAHAIHNGLSALPETHGYFHGEKVAFGVLAGLHLTDSPREEMDTVYAFCESVGLPVTLSDIGIQDCSRDHLMKAAVKACAPGEAIHHEAMIVIPEWVVDAMIAADAMGRLRRQKQSNLKNK